MRRGYTIVELVIVLMILAILASAAAPRYVSALAEFRADAAASRVAADLRMIRQYARRDSQIQSVVFDAAADSYSAPSMPDVDRSTDAYTVNFGASEYVADLTSADFGGSATLHFDVFGRPNQSGAVVLQVGDLVRTVEIDEAGHVQIL
jgi:prepilin-type N-terminal cleavage/methylation domain-containing protein